MDTVKFDTCLYRSKDKAFSIETWCCGSKEIEGYLCFHPKVLNNNVTPEVCLVCNFYKPKNDNPPV